MSCLGCDARDKMLVAGATREFRIVMELSETRRRELLLRTALAELVDALGADYLSTDSCIAFERAEAVLEETK